MREGEWEIWLDRDHAPGCRCLPSFPCLARRRRRRPLWPCTGRTLPPIPPWLGNLRRSRRSSMAEAGAHLREEAVDEAVHDVRAAVAKALQPMGVVARRSGERCAVARPSSAACH